MIKHLFCAIKDIICIVLTFLILLSVFDFVFCPNDLPKLIKWSGKLIPLTISFNRVEGRKITIAISWRFNTLSVGYDGIHIFKG